MGAGYSFYAKLKADYNQQNVQFILNQGKRIGLSYFTVSNENALPTVEEATSSIMTLNEIGTHCIIAKIHDKIPFMCVGSESGKNLAICWGDFYDIDVVEYMNKFIELIKDFAILDINIMVD